jgi:hypothetical protein
MKARGLALGTALVMITGTATTGLEGQTSLQGAWRVDALIGPGSRMIDSPQPGLLLFVDGHYSYTFVTSEGPRPPLPIGPTTPEALVDVWNPFTANAGTFEISGDTMRRRPIVAKSPDAMAPGAFNEYTFRVVADTLWVTPTGTEAGATRNATTVRYVRAR